MNLTVYLYDHGTQARLDAVAAALADSAAIHEAMAAGVERIVGDHLLGLNSRSPNTDFYASAARGIETEADGEGALVRIPKLGFALRYYGGTVTAGKGISSKTGKPTRALAIPDEDVPVVGPPDGRHRMRPGEWPGLLAFLPTKSTKSTGVLVEGEEKDITRGKNKGGKRIVPKVGGKLIYVLAESITFQGDESVLPSQGALFSAAAEAAEDYLSSFNDEGGEA